jgi:uncharacterized membrane protein YciS (DUF1049 family)
VGETLYGLDDEMIGFIVGAIIFSIPTIYYRIKLKQCEEEKKRIIRNSWQWQNWGE